MAYTSASMEFLMPGYKEEEARKKAEKIAEAREQRAKLTEFERLADPNNEEIMEQLKEIRRHVEALERQSGMFDPEPDDVADPVKINPKDSKGFVIP